MANEQQYDAVIIGAGPNGLSAAATLAREGLSTLVLEANDAVGGGARTDERTLPGFRHDICSTVMPLAAGSPFLRTLPLADHGLQWVHPDTALAHPLDDGPPAILARSIEATTASFDDDHDAQRYARFMQPLVQRWEALLSDVLAGPHLPRHPLLLARFGLVAGQPARAAAKAMFHGGHARALLAGISGHSMLPLERRPSAGFAALLALAGHAVGWPVARGGSQRVSEALASFIRANGGEIATGRRVASLDDLPPARAYLFDVTPRQLLDIAGDHLPSRYRRRLAHYRYGPGVFKIDWALDGPIPWRDEPCRGAGTLHLGGTLDEIAAGERAVWAGECPDRPFVLLAQQSICDPSRAPEGKHTVWAYCHVPHGSTIDMTQRIEQQIERFAPGFRERILARTTMNSAQLEMHNANCIGGDINGGVADIRQMLARPALRLTPYATPNPKIWICSASTPPGGGVHGMCGHTAARAVLRRIFGRRA